METYSSWWASHALAWLQFSRRLLVVHYEQLLKDLIHQLRLITEFLNVSVPEERLFCAERNRDGHFKRTGSQRLTFDPFTEDMRTRIDGYVREVDRALRDKNLSGLPQEYTLRWWTLEWWSSFRRTKWGETLTRKVPGSSDLNNTSCGLLVVDALFTLWLCYLNKQQLSLWFVHIKSHCWTSIHQGFFFNSVNLYFCTAFINRCGHKAALQKSRCEVRAPNEGARIDGSSDEMRKNLKRNQIQKKPILL